MASLLCRKTKHSLRLRTRFRSSKKEPPTCCTRVGPARAIVPAPFLCKMSACMSAAASRDLVFLRPVNQASQAGRALSAHEACPYSANTPHSHRLFSNPSLRRCTRMGHVLSRDPHRATRAACDIAPPARSPTPLGQSPHPTSNCIHFHFTCDLRAQLCGLEAGLI